MLPHNLECLARLVKELRNPGHRRANGAGEPGHVDFAFRQSVDNNIASASILENPFQTFRQCTVFTGKVVGQGGQFSSGIRTGNQHRQSVGSPGAIVRFAQECFDCRPPTRYGGSGRARLQVRQQLDRGVNPTRRMRIVQFVFSFKSLHPNAASRAIEPVPLGLPLDPDATEQHQAPSCTHHHASCNLIHYFGNAGNRGLRIHGVNTEQEASILPDSRCVESVLPQPCRDVLRRPPLGRRSPCYPDRTRNRDHDIERARGLQRELVCLVDDVGKRTSARLVLEAVLPPAMQKIRAVSHVQQMGCNRACSPLGPRRGWPSERARPPRQIPGSRSLLLLQDDLIVEPPQTEFRLQGMSEQALLLIRSCAGISSCDLLRHVRKKVQGFRTQDTGTDGCRSFQHLAERQTEADVPEPAIPRRPGVKEVEQSGPGVDVRLIDGLNHPELF